MSNSASANEVTEDIFWTRMYANSIQEFGNLCMSVLELIAEGGSLADVVELVENTMDNRDMVDENTIALFERAKVTSGHRLANSGGIQDSANGRANDQ